MITSKTEVNEYNLSLEMQQIVQKLGLKNIDEALYFPKFFQIETVRVCNARCPFCAIDLWDKSVPFMPDELFDKIVDELSHYADWITLVDLQRDGEPLLDKKIVDRVAKMKQIGIKRVAISTNASLLNEEKAYALLEAGLDEMMISIDAIEKEDYERLRVGLKFETVIRNIQTFFRVRDEVKPEAIIRIRGVSFFDLEKEEDRKALARWEDYFHQWTQSYDRVYMKRAINWGNQKTWEDKLIAYDWVYHPCIIPWGTFHITTRGVVPLCPEDFNATMNLGNIYEQSIAEVWRSEKWNRIRGLHRTGNRNDIQFCQGCRTFDEEEGPHQENWRQKGEKYKTTE